MDGAAGRSGTTVGPITGWSGAIGIATGARGQQQRLRVPQARRRRQAAPPAAASVRLLHLCIHPVPPLPLFSSGRRDDRDRRPYDRRDDRYPPRDGGRRRDDDRRRDDRGGREERGREERGKEEDRGKREQEPEEGEQPERERDGGRSVLPSAEEEQPEAAPANGEAAKKKEVSCQYVRYVYWCTVVFCGTAPANGEAAKKVRVR